MIGRILKRIIMTANLGENSKYTRLRSKFDSWLAVMLCWMTGSHRSFWWRVKQISTRREIYERTDLIPSSISPPLLRTECRKLRRKVNRRRKRGGASLDGLDESPMVCTWFGGDWELEFTVDEVGWSNRSKNVLFLLDEVRRAGVFSLGEVGSGRFVLFETDVGIGMGFVVLFDSIAVVILGFEDEGEDDDDEVGDEAKYTVSVVIGEW